MRSDENREFCVLLAICALNSLTQLRKELGVLVLAERLDDRRISTSIYVTEYAPNKRADICFEEDVPAIPSWMIYVK